MTAPTRRELLALAAALSASPAFAQEAAPPAAAAAPAPTPPAPTTPVALTTPLGRIVIALETTRAPLTAGHFLQYVDRKLYDGATFYRASRPKGSTADDIGLVQGGLKDPAKLLGPIAHESTLATGLRHVNGTISMGRLAPGTADADWFICLGDQAYLDADAANPGFAAFGHVTEGLEVVKQILVMPVDPTKGEGSMKGEMLAHPVPIVSARRA